MTRNSFSEFEEIVLLAVAALHGGAYGAAIMDELEMPTGRSVSLSAVHAVLLQPVQNRMPSSRLGEAKAERGGRRKRLFFVTCLVTGSRKASVKPVTVYGNRFWPKLCQHQVHENPTAPLGIKNAPMLL